MCLVNSSFTHSGTDVSGYLIPSLLIQYFFMWIYYLEHFFIQVSNLFIYFFICKFSFLSFQYQFFKFSIFISNFQ